MIKHIEQLMEAHRDIFKPMPEDEQRNIWTDFLAQMVILEGWKLTDHGIEVPGTVNFGEDFTDVEELPFKFWTVGGDFLIYNGVLATLAGCPVQVKKTFDCEGNMLTSLKGGPKFVGAHYECGWNVLNSLEGAPEFIPGNFSCSNNNLVDLRGGPRVVMGDYRCENCNIRSFKGAPEYVGGNFYYAKNSVDLEDYKELQKWWLQLRREGLKI